MGSEGDVIMMDRLEKWNMPKDRMWDKKTGEEIRNPAPEKQVLYVPWIASYYGTIKELDLKCEKKETGYRPFSTYINPSGRPYGFAYVVPDSEPLLAQAIKIY